MSTENSVLKHEEVMDMVNGMKDIDNTEDAAEDAAESSKKGRRGTIRINSDYVVDIDNYSYTAQQDLHKKMPDGTPMKKTIGYFSTLSGALNGILKQEAKNRLTGKDNPEVSLAQAVETIRNVHKEFAELFECATGEPFKEV